MLLWHHHCASHHSYGSASRLTCVCNIHALIVITRVYILDVVPMCAHMSTNSRGKLACCIIVLLLRSAFTVGFLAEKRRCHDDKRG